MAILTREAAATRGDELALADDDDARTWAQLDARVNRLVHALRDAGLGSGDTISVVAGNRNEWFEVALACAHAGVVFVPVSWHLVASEMAYIIEDSDSRAVLVGHRFTDMVAEALADPRSSAVELAVAIGAPDDTRFVDFEAFLGSGSDAEPEDQSFGGPMFYTSGTTGHPK
ncbi:MAG TPA: AMP-binding protein, partial [Acidimicrobiales bacterium]|nr:AMP-binding protein [Acidimicrobiales bacterium]